ncbi:DoxX family protein [Vibrio ulleungensis]|uniref:DoxX family protein n=1 Tax=Vibrio ulleungensis TaxID=2807619 RepID=A0ABS2HM38_9VIBR|nr:DoxX family protein [Vibrio ulleungensis]MBM7036901.1 DoxX family protein [Vibrio ulleungensis]
MKKLNITFYFVSILFALAMAASGVAKLTEQEALVQSTQEMGYPLYLLTILGAAYLIGAGAILQPKYETLRQWGYAGFTIALIGAAASHILAGQAFGTAVPALVLLLLLATAVVLNHKR